MPLSILTAQLYLNIPIIKREYIMLNDLSAAAEMKLLRSLAGYTLYYHKTNDSIRRELKITFTLNKIDEYRLNWLLHLQRMPQNRIPLKSYHYRPQGRRTIGRPEKSWREQF
jgi:hypothetical protein